MKKLIPIILALLCLTACGKKEEAKPETPDTAPVTQVVNPFTNCETLAEAEELAGFSISIPEEIGGCPVKAYRVMNRTMLEIIYEGDGNKLYIRKAAEGSEINGDYNNYAESRTVSANGIEYSLSGNDGEANLVLWTADGYTYVAGLDGISFEDAPEILSLIR